VEVLEICFVLVLRMGFIRIICVKLKDINPYPANVENNVSS